eukprot:481784-Hanusia_phi.AAC.6
MRSLPYKAFRICEISSLLMSSRMELTLSKTSPGILSVTRISELHNQPSWICPHNIALLPLVNLTT